MATKKLTARTIVLSMTEEDMAYIRQAFTDYRSGDEEGADHEDLDSLEDRIEQAWKNGR